MTFPKTHKERAAHRSLAKTERNPWFRRLLPDLASERATMRSRAYLGMAVLFALLMVFPVPATCQEKQDPGQGKTGTVPDQPARFFSWKLPDGFKAETVEEPGIARWTKDSAEIYLAVGEIFQESADVLFDSLRKAADQDKRIEGVSTLRLKKGRALFFKEKAPEDSSRLQGWRLVVITDKKVLSIDFTAPAKDFEKFAPDFEKVVKSFKLKSAS
jgi:hypothetical protein